MASIVVAGDTSGSVTLTAPLVAGTTTLTLPTTNGTLALTSQLPASPSAVGQVPFSTDGSTYTATAKIVLGTAVTSTSGTSIDFTGIPSWAKRVTVMLNNVSANNFGRIFIQLGTGGTPTTSGYVSNYNYISTNNATVRSNNLVTSAFPLFADEAGDATTGVAVFTLLTGNTWMGIGGSLIVGPNAGSGNSFMSVSLAGALNMIRVTTSTGTPTFDSGTINIMWE
jgi:hypothetical protein